MMRAACSAWMTAMSAGRLGRGVGEAVFVGTGCSEGLAVAVVAADDVLGAPAAELLGVEEARFGVEEAQAVFAALLEALEVAVAPVRERLVAAEERVEVFVFEAGFRVDEGAADFEVFFAELEGFFTRRARR